MFNKAGRNIFYMAVYFSGILIGEIYTPQVMSYAKQLNAQKQEQGQEQIQQKPQKSKKVKSAGQQVV